MFSVTGTISHGDQENLSYHRENNQPNLFSQTSVKTDVTGQGQGLGEDETDMKREKKDMKTVRSHFWHNQEGQMVESVALLNTFYISQFVSSRISLALERLAQVP